MSSYQHISFLTFVRKNYYMKLSILLIFLLSTITSLGQHDELSKMLKVDLNTFIIKYEKGDFNNDGIIDYVTIDSTRNNKSTEVKIHIYEGKSKNNFIKKSSSKNLSDEFVFNNNPIIKITDKGVISFFHQSMRHDYELKIRFEKNYKDYIIIGSEYHNYGNGAYNTSVSSNYLIKQRIIKETVYDKKAEQFVEKSLKKENIASEAISLSHLNDDNIYNLFD